MEDHLLCHPVMKTIGGLTGSVTIDDIDFDRCVNHQIKDGICLVELVKLYSLASEGKNESFKL